MTRPATLKKVAPDEGKVILAKHLEFTVNADLSSGTDLKMATLGMRRQRSFLMAGIVAPMMLNFAACGGPTVSSAQVPTKVNELTYKVGGYEVRYLELQDGQDTIEFPEPVLIVPIQITNNGAQALTYAPTHAIPEKKEATTPLLYKDPGGGELPPASKEIVSSVQLGRGTLSGQLTEPKSIGPGETASDLLLFKVPDETTSKLVLSMPPSIHGGTAPALFRFAFTPTEPEGPKVFSVGEEIEFAGAMLTVDGVSLEYVPVKEGGKLSGYSKTPLLKLAYTITHKGEGELEYEPSHRALQGAASPSVKAGQEALKRVQFDAASVLDGQLQQAQTIASGTSVKDYSLFSMPDEGTTQLRVEFPASLFGRKGIARVQVPYEHKMPEKPKDFPADK
ncbi:MAG: hypothetical protein AAGI01_09220 [Myxococcota bacterium]